MDKRLFTGKPLQIFAAFVGGILVTALSVSHPLFSVVSVGAITYLGFKELNRRFPQA
jgi:hypothetical protein